MGADTGIVAKFSATLKNLMAERGVSASVLSQATGIPKSSLSEWLSGRKPMLDESIVRLAILQIPLMNPRCIEQYGCQG